MKLLGFGPGGVYPDALLPFVKEAKKLLLDGGVEEVVFSGPTYQIRCKAPGEPVWVFLQLDAENKVKDLFCSCGGCSEKGACVHMAMALAAVFKKFSLPLHTRFAHSPFLKICFPFAFLKGLPICTDLGTSIQLSVGKNTIECRGPRAFLDSIVAIVQPKDEETEETSIKFSEATDEEMAAWRRGDPSDRLRFELSFFSDLAKLLFWLSDDGSCAYRFPETSLRRLDLSFGEIVCSFPLLGPLGPLLDVLPRDQTTPKLYPHGGREISGVSVSSKTRSIQIQYAGEPIDVSAASEIEDAQWSYLPSLGFIKQAPQKSEILTSVDEICAFLDEYLPASRPCPLSYHITVQEDVGLRITPYLDTPKDLHRAIFWGRWGWSHKRDFFQIDPLQGSFEEQDISLEDLSDFLLSHRHWLSNISGFTVSDHAPQEVVTYEVDADGGLSFHREYTGKAETARQRLGGWLYVRGKGFFPADSQQRIEYDVLLPPHRVPEFLQREAEWLKGIPGFFAAHDPIKGVALEIQLIAKEVRLSPVFQWKDPKYEKIATLYDGVGFIPKIGFFVLPSVARHQALLKTYSPSDREGWDSFCEHELPQLQSDFSCIVDPSLLPPKNLQLVCVGLEPHELEIGQRVPAWWKAEFHWESDRGLVVPEILLKAYRQGNRFVPTPAGLIDLSEERFGWLASVFQRSEKGRRFQTVDFLKIKAHDEFSFSPNVGSTTASVIERLLKAESPAQPNLQAFSSSLRPYQLRGVEWLWYLYVSGLSGLLCDDMGVGKTHQAMALMGAIRAAADTEGRPKPRFLVLCPASLVWHWKEKMRATLPSLSCLLYVGPDRSSLDIEEGYDVLLTTYGIWRAEVRKLHSIPFELAIFDELQIAKNHVSQIWTALSKVRSSMRLGLTGTPVENQLRELRAVFDLVLPGYLPGDGLLYGSRMSFDENDGRDLLSRYVRPFLLRRRKQDVLPDLPQKIEEIYPTELVGDQLALYRQVAAQQGAPLISQLHDESQSIPYMHIFALLSALKQICDHPAVFTKDTEHYTQYESGKWDSFVELLEEAQESGQKVVVFSQFLSMLDIMGLHLKANNIGYAEIRGSTRQRGDEIDRFQNDPSCKVFLGSLQASGLGIDLTAGSIVIHYDRWWNAARENQATDRVHRIGQNRGVMVYKLMTTNTIEERIDQIIARKARLFEDVISYDDHHMIKKLDRSELLELLQGI